MHHRAVILAYLVALGTFSGVALLAARHVASLGTATAWVQHTQEVLTAIQSLLGELRDIETGQRGYLLSGDERFLEPYERGGERVLARFEELRNLTADNDAQQARLRRIRPLVREKMAFAEEAVARFRAGERDRAREMVIEGRGESIMDEIRRELAAMETQEQQLLAARTRRSDRIAWRTTTLMFVGDGIAFSALAAGTLLTARELARRRQHAQDAFLRRRQSALDARTERIDARVEALLEQVPLAMMIVDGEGTPRVLSPAMRALRRDATAKGPPVAIDLVRADGTAYAEGRDPVARATRDGAVTRDEPAQLVRSDRGRLDVIVDATPARAPDGRVVGAVVVVRDVAETRRIEEERLWFSRFRDVFVSALGHDLRNPLSVITAGTASLARRVRGDADAKLVARMHASAERMALMIDQLLEMTRTRLGGGLAIERVETDTGAIARRVVERLEVTMPERRIELAMHGDLTGTWDEPRLERAIGDVVRNAIAHGSQDAPVRLVVSDRGDEVEIEVHNTGNPIEDEQLALMFDPFRRAAERKRTRSVGLGIGLYLARETVLAHGGQVDVRSSADAGTRVRLVLPRR